MADVTFLSLQNKIYTKLAEEKGDTGFWPTSEVKDAINDVYYHLADITHLFKVDDVIKVTSGTAIYNINNNYDIISKSIRRVEYDEQRLTPYKSYELDIQSSAWRDDSDTPTGWLAPGDVCDEDEIMLYPNPDTTGETEPNPVNNIRLFASQYPTALSADGDVPEYPFNNNPRNIFVKGALAILFEKDGEGQDIQKASYYHKRYIEAIPIKDEGTAARLRMMSSIISQGQSQ